MYYVITAIYIYVIDVVCMGEHISVKTGDEYDNKTN